MEDYTVGAAGLTVDQVPSGSGGSTPSSSTKRLREIINDPL